MNIFYSQLKGICDQYFLRKKILLMPSFSSGYQLQKSAARRRINTINMEVETPGSLLKDKGAKLLKEKDLEFIGSDTGKIVVMQVMQELKEAEELNYFAGMELSPGLLSSIYTFIRKMRLAGISASDLSCKNFVVPAKGQDLRKVFISYNNYLKEGGYTDRAGLIDIILCNDLTGDDSVYILPENLRLSYLEKEFLKKLKNNSEMVYILNTPELYGIDAPLFYKKSFGKFLAKDTAVNKKKNNYYNYLFSIEDMPNNDNFKQNIRLSTARGESSEVRGIFRKIKEKEISLDKTAIFYTKREPYVQLVRGLSEKLDIPVTFGEGISVKNTLPGQLFYTLLEWVESDYSYAKIYRLLRDGIFSIDDNLNLQWTAYFLRQLKIGRSRKRYRTVLARELDKNQDNENLQVINNFFEKIFKLLPEVKEGGLINSGLLAEGLSQVLSEFSSIKNELDKEAVAVICGRLEIFAKHYNFNEDFYRAINRVESLMSGTRVGISSPEPGKVHIDSYRRGLWVDREVTFLAGLSAEQFPGVEGENPVFLKEEIEEFKNINSRNREKEEIYKMTEFLSSRTGPIYVSYSSFDTIDNTEINPSRYFLQLYRYTNKDPDKDYSELAESLNSPEEFIPHRAENSLDKNSFWLYYQMRKGGIEKGDEILLSLFPGIIKGKRAEEKRYSGNFNKYCGNVQMKRQNIDNVDNIIFSASKLEEIAVCPFQYFLDYILKLESPEDMERTIFQWLDAMDRGSLLHKIFEKFYREIADKEESISEKKHRELIINIAENEAKKLREISPPPSEIVYERELQEIKESCFAFLASEQDYNRSRKPKYFELTFGPGKNEKSTEFKAGPAELGLPSGGNFKLAGKIDRVDQVGPLNYDIIDYKTGSSSRYTARGNFNQGQQIQHALYALAFEDIMKGSVNVDKSGYVFPTLRGGGEKIWHEDKEREKVLEIVELLLETITAGSFHPAVYDYQQKACKWCDYNNLVCEREKNDIITEMIRKSNNKDIKRWKGLKNYD